MNQLAFLLLLLIGSTCLIAQTDTTYIPVVAYWDLKDEFHYQVTTINRQVQSGALTKNDTSSYSVSLKVLEANETSYLLSWGLKSNPGVFNVPDYLLQELEAYTIKKVIYRTTETGEFVGVENWEEISAIMDQFFDAMAEKYFNEEGRGQEIEQILAPVREIYQSKEGIENLAFDEVQILHFPFGYEYSVSDTLRYEELFPNMLGGDPIRANTILYMDSVAMVDSYCSLTEEMELNPDDTRLLVTELFKRMGLNDKELEDAIATSTIDITDRNRYEVYYDTGLPLRIHTYRKSIIDIPSKDGNTVNTKEVIIERIE